MANGAPVGPTPVTAWQLIGAAVSVMAIIVYSLWSVITDQNRSNEVILNELRRDYVTKAQHNDLADRFSREVGRVDDLARNVLPRNEFDRWVKQHDSGEEDIKKRIEDASARIRALNDRLYFGAGPIKNNDKP